MTIYGTMNPIGSTELPDLRDNAQNLDFFSVGTGNSYQDRFGELRISIRGIQALGLEAIASVGYIYTTPLNYAAGIDITLPNQIFLKDGEYYKAGPSLSLPYTTTGVWSGASGESGSFLSVGDAVLRGDLSAENGVQLISGAAATVSSIAALKALPVGRASKWATVQNSKFVSFFRYDANSSAAADNATVVAPNSGPGRWLINHNGSMSLYQWGAVGDKVADDTAAVQAAVNWAGPDALEILVPSCAAFRTTSTINVSGSPRFTGQQVQISKTAGQNANEPGKGSWFYFDHLGMGMKFNDQAIIVQRPVLERIGSIRNQPVPGSAAYTPADNDWDFYFYNCDSIVRDISMWNPTKGIYITANAQNSQSRGDISGVYGCPYQYGIIVDFLADVIRIDNIHWWPYTSGNPVVADYIRNNFIGIETRRCDNPMITRYFTYGAKHSLHIAANSLGTTSKIKMSMFDFDAFGAQAIFVTGAGATGSFTQGVAQGQNPNTTENFFETGPATSGCNFAISDVDVGLCGKNVFRCGGSVNNVLRLGDNIRCYQWNGSNGGWPAIDCTPGNFVEVASMPYFTAPLNSGVALGNSGTIKANATLAPQAYNTDPSGRVAIAPGLGRAPSLILASAVSDSAALHVQQTTQPNVLMVSSLGTGAPLANSPVTIGAQISFN